MTWKREIKEEREREGRERDGNRRTRKQTTTHINNLTSYSDSTLLPIERTLTGDVFSSIINLTSLLVFDRFRVISTRRDRIINWSLYDLSTHGMFVKCLFSGNYNLLSSRDKEKPNQHHRIWHCGGRAEREETRREEKLPLVDEVLVKSTSIEIGSDDKQRFLTRFHRVAAGWPVWPEIQTKIHRRCIDKNGNHREFSISGDRSFREIHSKSSANILSKSISTLDPSSHW